MRSLIYLNGTHKMEQDAFLRENLQIQGLLITVHHGD